MTALVAIIDIGKTNAKLAFVEASTGREVFCVRRTNQSLRSPPIQQLDVEAIETWLLESFRQAPQTADVVAIVPIAHGATAVLIDAYANVVAAPDYEDSRYERISAAYDRERDIFAQTLSPSLPLGLNLARQLFYLEKREPEIFARTSRILLYPQYWAWRFSEVMASEVTSLGCHTDLWRPGSGTFSALAMARGWNTSLPPIRPAAQSLGTITPRIAALTGLRSDCRVACGIHDSNASYLEHLLERPRDQPFAVISSGTWTVVMANRADLTRLRAERDMLANVDAFGSAVATARFMGGREYEVIAGTTARPDLAALESVIRQQAHAIPSFAEAGPFPSHRGRLIAAAGLNEPARAALATLYVALMSELLLELLDADQDVLVDGPLASNPLFASLLATWRPRARVFVNSGAGGVCARAATWLAGFGTAPAPSTIATAFKVDGLDAYRDAWRRQLPG